MTAIRERSVRLWIAGISLLAFATTYAAPVVTALQLQPVSSSVPDPLPALSVPAVAFPTLQVPEVSPPLPRAAMPKRSAAPSSTPRAGRPAAVSPARPVPSAAAAAPVVTDEHTREAVAPATAAPAPAATAEDEAFAKAPVVDDQVGPLPPPLPQAPAPAAPQRPATPPAAPAEAETAAPAGEAPLPATELPAPKSVTFTEAAEGTTEAPAVVEAPAAATEAAAVQASEPAAETEAAAAEGADATATEPAAAEASAAEPGPAGDTAAAGTPDEGTTESATETPAAQEQPAEEQAAQEQPAQEQPAQEQPAQEQPAQEQPAQEQPAQQQEQPAAQAAEPAAQEQAGGDEATEQQAAAAAAPAAPEGESGGAVILAAAADEVVDATAGNDYIVVDVTDDGQIRVRVYNLQTLLDNLSGLDLSTIFSGGFDFESLLDLVLGATPFDVPTSSLTVNGLGGWDVVEIAESLTLPGVGFTVNAEAIVVKSGVTIDTTSGNINLNASDVQTQTPLSVLGAQLAFHLGLPGVVAITDYLDELDLSGLSSDVPLLGEIQLSSALAKVAATGATIKGGQISMIAAAAAVPNGPSGLKATAQAGGSLAVDTHTYRVTALIGSIETIGMEVALKVEGTDQTAALTWDAVPGADGGYRVYRKTGAGGSYAGYYTVAAGTTTFSDTGAAFTVGSGTPPDEKRFTVAISLAQLALDGTAVQATGATTLQTTSTIMAVGAHTAASGSGSAGADVSVSGVIAIGLATTDVKNASTLTVDGATLTITAANHMAAHATANAELAGGGGAIALAVAVPITRAAVEGGSTISASGLTLSAQTTNDVKSFAKGSPGGASANNNSPNNRTKGNATTAESGGGGGGGGSVDLVGSLAFTWLESSTEAYVSGANATTAGGAQQITAASTDSSSATANSEATGSCGSCVGVAVAVNVARVGTHAYVAGASQLLGTSVTVQAQAPASGTGGFAAEAKSGIGSPTSVGIAGALAVGFLDSDTTSALRSGGNVTVDGNATISAASNRKATVKATPKPGAAPGSANLGVGASIGINIVEDTTTATIEDTALLTGAKSLSLTATSTSAAETEAQGGSAGGTAFTAVAAITFSTVTTTAAIGTGGLISAESISATATQDATASAKAKGDANGSSTAAVGLSLALVVANHLVEAATLRDLTATTGGITFAANGSSASTSEASASATGAQGQGAGGKDASNKTANQKADDQLAKANQTSTNNGGSGSGKSTTPEAKSGENGGSAVSVAAAFAITISGARTRATLADGLTLTAANGAVGLNASANADASSKADGKAVGSSSANIGAAIAVTRITVENTARVGEDTLTNSKGLTVSAAMRNKSGDQTHTFLADATAGAGQGSVGVAGSLALTIADVETNAVILSNAGRGPPDLHNGNVSLSAVSTVESTVKAKAKAEDADTVGVGAGAAVNSVDDTTSALVAAGARLTNVNDVTLTATGTNTLVTYAEAGTGGGPNSTLALTADAAITLANVRTSAAIAVGSPGTELEFAL